MLDTCPISGIAFRNLKDMRLNIAGEETPIVLACFHHHGEVRQLRCTTVNIETEKVILYDLRSRITLGISVLHIYLHQYIKSIDEEVTGADTGIEGGNILRSDFLVDCLYRPVLRLNKVGQLIRKRTARITLDPVPAHGIIDQIADYPVRGEKLCCGRNIIFFYCFI